MVYHFVKHIGIDVEADSLETAKKIVADLDNYDEYVEEYIKDNMDECIEYGDFADEAEDYDVHIGNAEYVGYTEDEKNNPEKRLYDYLTGEDDGVRYAITDKGRDFLANLRGEYPEYDESNYDEHGNRIAYSLADFAEIIVSFLNTRARP